MMKLCENNEKRNWWVCCPACGKKHHKSVVSHDTYICDTCRTEFTAWVVKGFVTVFENKPDDSGKSFEERFSLYHEQLMMLAE
jgi:ribosomal protein L37AE/L43A